MSGNKGTPSGSAAKVPGPSAPFLLKDGSVNPLWRAFFWTLGTQLSVSANGQTLASDATNLNFVGGLQINSVGSSIQISAGSEWIFKNETYNPVSAVDVGLGLLLEGLQDGTILLSLDTSAFGLNVYHDNAEVLKDTSTIDFTGNVYVDVSEPGEVNVDIPYLRIMGESNVPLLSPTQLTFKQVTALSFAADAILSGQSDIKYIGTEQFVGYSIGNAIPTPGTLSFDPPAATMEFVAATSGFGVPSNLTQSAAFTIGSIYFVALYIPQPPTLTTLGWGITGLGFSGQANNIKSAYQDAAFGGFSQTVTAGSLVALPDIIPGGTLGYVMIGVMTDTPTSITLESTLGSFDDLGPFTGTTFTQGSLFMASFASEGTLDATVVLGASMSVGIVVGTMVPGPGYDSNSSTITVTVPFTSLTEGTSVLTTELLTLDVGDGLTATGSGVTGTIALSLTASDGTNALGTILALESGTGISLTAGSATLTIDSFLDFVEGSSTIPTTVAVAGGGMGFVGSTTGVTLWSVPDFGYPALVEGTLTEASVAYMELGTGLTMTTLATVPPILGSVAAAGYLGSAAITRSLGNSMVFGFNPGGSQGNNLGTTSIPGIYVGTLFGFPYEIDGFAAEVLVEAVGSPTYETYALTTSTTLTTTTFVNSGTLDEVVLFCAASTASSFGTLVLTNADLVSEAGGGNSSIIFVGVATLTASQTLAVSWTDVNTWTSAGAIVLTNPAQGVLLEAIAGEPTFVDGTFSETAPTLVAGGNITFTGTTAAVTISANGGSGGSTLDIVSGPLTLTNVSTIELGNGLTASVVTSTQPQIVQSASYSGVSTGLTLANPVGIGNFLVALVAGASLTQLPLLESLNGGYETDYIFGTIATSTIAPALTCGGNVAYLEIANSATYSTGPLTISTSGSLTTAVFDNARSSENLLLFMAQPNGNIAGGAVTIVSPSNFTAPYVYPVVGGTSYGAFLGEVPSVAVGTASSIEWDYANTFVNSPYILFEPATAAGEMLLSATASELDFVDGTVAVASPTLVAGTNVSFTGTTAAVTIAASGGGAALEVVSGTTSVTGVSEIVLGANLSLTTSTTAGVLTLAAASTASANLTFEQGGTSIAAAGTLDFGSGLTATAGGGIVTLTASGGAVSYAGSNILTTFDFGTGAPGSYAPSAYVTLAANATQEIWEMTGWLGWSGHDLRLAISINDSFAAGTNGFDFEGTADGYFAGVVGPMIVTLAASTVATTIGLAASDSGLTGAVSIFSQSFIMRQLA